MTAKRNGNNSSFIDQHLGSIIVVLVLAAGQIFSYAKLDSKVEALDTSTKTLSTTISSDTVRRSEHLDLLRRTELLEKELVPRGEHLLRDAEINKRLDEIRDNIKEVRDRVEVIDNRQRGVR